MRRIKKSQTPNVLTIYAATNCNDSWDTFKKNNAIDASEIKKKIFEEQGDICAYCETDLSIENVFEHQRRVEHFNSKSAWRVGQVQPNLHLDWNNVIGVCIGGTDKDNCERYVMPDNKSCDSYKEHLETNCRHSKLWTGKVVSPLETVLCSQMFQYCMASGELSVNKNHTNSVVFQFNDYATSAELLENTLISFNLNCDRLNLARKEVQYGFERIKTEFRKTKNVDKFKFKVRKWSDDSKVKSFQTTRDILIRNCKVAQKFLANTD